MGIVIRGRSGLSVWAERRAVEQKKWRELFPGVCWTADREPDPEEWCDAALIWAGDGAALCGPTAARIHQLDGEWPTLPVHLVVPRKRGPRAENAVVSRSSLDWVDLDPAFNHQRTSLSRTLVELAASLPEPDFAIAFESGWRRYRFVREELAAHLEEVPRRSGSQTLRRVLHDSQRRRRPLRSALEVKMSRFLVEHRLPQPEPDLKVVDREGVMFLDFAYPDRRFAIETDGLEYHSGAGNVIRDSRRRQRLIALGWTVFNVTSVELKDHPDRVLERLRRSFERYPRSKRLVTGLGIVRAGR